jgi:hypothetical protein
MSEAAGSPGTNVAGEEKIVVLLLPELLGGSPDAGLLRATFGDKSRTIRALLYLRAGANPSLANILPELGIETEVLLGPDANEPAIKAFVARMLPGTSAQDEVDLAFAFSDVLLVAPEAEQNPAVLAAAEMGKPIVQLGKSVGPLPSHKIDIDRLDPDRRTWRRAYGRRMFGRIEQGVLELFAFNWRGRKKRGFAESFKRLRKCCGTGWGPGAYFAPDSWPDHAPDSNARDQSANIVAWFDAFDRSALYGSYIHRDLVWLEYLGAAFAVLLAVAGSLNHSKWWGAVELVTLLLVAFMVLWARWTSLLDRWTACRLAAEQLRIARMSLPLLVLPPGLATADKPPPRSARQKDTQFDFVALMQVKRLVRDHGLPRLGPSVSPVTAAKWLQLIVADQLEYHHRNHHKLHHAEQRLLVLSQLIFASALIAVLAHFRWHEASWLILFTAAAPAFAAALHGTGTRLGIVHRTALSTEMELELARIDGALKAMIEADPPTANWRDVRRLAADAAETMGRENTSWHGLVRRYRDELP